MGTAVHARKTKVYVDGIDLSNYFQSYDSENSAPALDATCFAEASADKVYAAASTPDAKVSLRGLWASKQDDATPANRNAVDDVLQPALGDSTKSYNVTICAEGADAVHLNALNFKTKLTKYSIAGAADTLLSCMADMQADGGLGYGVLLAQPAARTTTANGTSYDFGVATPSAFGFTANVHATAVGAATSFVVVIEDSADNATFATIGTFASVAAIGSARLEVSGTVRRYVRARWTFTGSAATTFLVSFSLKQY